MAALRSFLSILSPPSMPAFSFALSSKEQWAEWRNWQAVGVAQGWEVRRYTLPSLGLPLVDVKCSGVGIEMK